MATKHTQTRTKKARAKSNAKAPRRASTKKAPAERAASRLAKQQAFKTRAHKTPRRKPLALEVDPDVLEFIDAIERFKKSHARPFPSWSEILYVVRELGYRK